MKKMISFLCRMPGIFLVTAAILAVSLLIHWPQLDERWGLPTIMAVVMTLYGNFYLFFIQGEKAGYFIKGGKWIPIVLISIMTFVSISGLISIKQQIKIEFPGDHAVQSVMWESMTGVLVWAWFTLLWNMRWGNRHMAIHKELPANKEKGRRFFISEDNTQEKPEGKFFISENTIS